MPLHCLIHHVVYLSKRVIRQYITDPIILYHSHLLNRYMQCNTSHAQQQRLRRPQFNCITLTGTLTGTDCTHIAAPALAQLHHTPKTERCWECSGKQSLSPQHDAAGPDASWHRCTCQKYHTSHYFAGITLGLKTTVGGSEGVHTGPLKPC